MSQWLRALLLSGSRQLPTVLGSSMLVQRLGTGTGTSSAASQAPWAPVSTCTTAQCHLGCSMYKLPGSHMSLQVPAKQGVLTGTRNIRHICCSLVTEQLAAVLNGAANCV